MLGIYTYSYNDSGAWKDQLTGYSFQDYYKNDSFSGTITYDVMGNPLTYFNGKKNWNFIWKYGRQLASATDGTHTITNTYDVDGVRESKTVDGVEHKYVTLDGKIIRETYGTVTVDYFYDNEGRPYKLVVDEDNSTSGGSYTGYFVLNQQGDVIAILNANGVKVVSYEYNAWGQIKEETATSTNVGTLFLEHNALKYRGYYYDAETGFYYVSSRYYDPEVGRWINADDPDILFEDQDNILENNLYTYCFNNPVNYEDSSGYAATMALRMGTRIALKGLGRSALLSLAGSITPAGWVVISVVIVGGIVYAKTKKAKTKQEVDPYARPGQKKQGREKKNKSRRNDNFEDRSNKRTKKPLPHHTPGKDHQKYNQKR